MRTILFLAAFFSLPSSKAYPASKRSVETPYNISLATDLEKYKFVVSSNEDDSNYSKSIRIFVRNNRFEKKPPGEPFDIDMNCHASAGTAICKTTILKGGKPIERAGHIHYLKGEKKDLFVIGGSYWCCDGGPESTISVIDHELNELCSWKMGEGKHSNNNSTKVYDKTIRDLLKRLTWSTPEKCEFHVPEKYNAGE